MIRVYTTAKVIHAQMLAECRAKYDGIYFTARWPLVANVSSEKVRPVMYWLNDNVDDIERSEYVILYAEKHDELKTSLIEIGHAMRAGKKVVTVGENKAFEPWSAVCFARVKTMDEAIKRIRADANPLEGNFKDYYQVGQKILKTNERLVQYIIQDGGPWLPAPVRIGDKLFALKFESGRIFDAVLGWRDDFARAQTNAKHGLAS